MRRNPAETAAFCQTSCSEFLGDCGKPNLSALCLFRHRGLPGSAKASPWSNDLTKVVSLLPVPSGRLGRETLPTCALPTELVS